MATICSIDWRDRRWSREETIAVTKAWENNGQNLRCGSKMGSYRQIHESYLEVENMALDRCLAVKDNGVKGDWCNCVIFPGLPIYPTCHFHYLVPNRMIVFIYNYDHATPLPKAFSGSHHASAWKKQTYQKPRKKMNKICARFLHGPVQDIAKRN